jgi:alpha-glucosidase
VSSRSVPDAGAGRGAPQEREAAWWQRGVIYQIYPRSFMDSDGDGVGDLAGITARLDHLNDGTPGSLGVDAIWLSPFYPSPMADFGYDVADYCDVDQSSAPSTTSTGWWPPPTGGACGCCSTGCRTTFDQHPWFLASRSDRDDPKRDWYIWRDSRPGGGPPSNWLDYTGESAWRWDERTGQYYYRVFLDAQPDLNWRNSPVQAAMFDTLRFWLARGVDGFRIDVLSLLVEDNQLRDNPPNPHYRPGEDFPFMRELSVWNVDRPETR